MAGLGERLQAWGFSSAGLRDNRHGEWWLIAQMLLITAHLLPPLPPPVRLGMDWPTPLRIAGIAVFVAGLALGVQGTLHLGESLSPLPEPMPDAALVTEGAYGRCRHPLYQALLVASLGVTLAYGSLLHLALLLLLGWVLGRKARREEEGLCRLHPQYADYRARTPAILPFLPWLDWRSA